MSIDTAKLVCFGLGGDTVEYGGGCRGSGYGTPENPHASAPGEGKRFPDGTPVIDKRAAVDTDEGYRWAIVGPMVNVDLPDGEIDQCPEPDRLFLSALAESGYGAPIAAHAVARKSAQRSCLDFVCTREYVEGWRAVGARIGEYRGGVIVWEGGADDAP